MKKYTYKKYIQTMMLAVAVIPFFSSCDYLDKEPDDMLTIDVYLTMQIIQSNGWQVFIILYPIPCGNT